ncbi:hypothetical protein [Streptomyces poonensis]|uniref:Uncharacterized protein n=1 Tax=Streptomyces poonensis TaxID=68255 RepID=A0A918P9P1_9ACTN|nr:hypothetical protein [Streptomyces poonensis]GGY91037.1 hypothetical protein GCM10010365_06800 [Streptomyces poonensis]GLJ87883.1 hypothetical protein GCM10017589_04830 [Streptomyces poonensis]
MEQRIGSSSQPLDVAAVNPAYIPGLTSPVSAEPKKDTGPEKGTDPEDAAEPGSETAEASREDEDSKEDTKAAEGSREEPGENPDEIPDEEPDEEQEDATGGPVFEAADRRARIVADHRGVRLRLDDQECEFRWDEIGALETETGRFGKRFTVTVHTTDRRWYPIEIEATSRNRFKEWEAELDEVLDAYFDDGEDGDAPDEAGQAGGADEGTDADEAGQDDRGSAER